MKRIFLITLCSLLFSCKNNKENALVYNADHIKIDWQYLQDDYYGDEQIALKNLKLKYPLFFPTAVSDSVWQKRRKDSAQLVLYRKSKNIFKDYKLTNTKLKQLFAQAEKVFPNFKQPKVVPLISDLDYDNKILFSKDFLIISTDMYLGSQDEVYQSFPTYLSSFYDIKYLEVDAAEKIIQQYYRKKSVRTFVEKMVEAGKKMLILDKLLPTKDNASKIYFTENQYNWAIENEREVWLYFLDKELLFSSDNSLNQRFLDTAPFSKFYLSTDRETPGRIAVFTGWQIVKRYLKRNDVDLKTLLKTPAMEIFEKANYKAK